MSNLYSEKLNSVAENSNSYVKTEAENMTGVDAEISCDEGDDPNYLITAAGKSECSDDMDTGDMNGGDDIHNNSISFSLPGRPGQFTITSIKTEPLDEDDYYKETANASSVVEQKSYTLIEPTVIKQEVMDDDLDPEDDDPDPEDDEDEDEGPLDMSVEDHSEENCYTTSEVVLPSSDVEANEDHTSAAFVCRQCGKGFAKKVYLKRHMKRLHSTVARPHSCTICSKGFLEIGKLRVHMLTHENIKRYSCDICGRGFNHMNNMTVHRQLHSGEKPYRCDVCGKSFALVSYHRIHMKIHTGEKPYKCEACGKTFRESQKLIIHSRTHTGEKPYKCEFCEKCFSNNTNLRTHMRLHTGDKPFKCVICGREFVQGGNLKMHMITHTRDTPKQKRVPKCHDCGRTFPSTEELLQHAIDKAADPCKKVQAKQSSSKDKNMKKEGKRKGKRSKIEDGSTHMCTGCGDVYLSQAELRKHMSEDMCGLSLTLNIKKETSKDEPLSNSDECSPVPLSDGCIRNGTAGVCAPLDDCLENNEANKLSLESVSGTVSIYSSFSEKLPEKYMEDNSEGEMLHNQKDKDSNTSTPSTSIISVKKEKDAGSSMTPLTMPIDSFHQSVKKKSKKKLAIMQNKTANSCSPEHSSKNDLLRLRFQKDGKSYHVKKLDALN